MAFATTGRNESGTASVEERHVEPSDFESTEHDAVPAAMPELPTRRPRRSRGGSLLWLAVGMVVLGSAFVAAALYTDRSEYCSSCHEMVPYGVRMEGDPLGRPVHRCHVEAGLADRFAHKFVALGEVRAHFTGDTKFPRPKPPVIPQDRCTRCHPSSARLSPRTASRTG